MCQDLGGLPLQRNSFLREIFLCSHWKKYVSFWICVISWFKKALCAWNRVLRASSCSWIKCFSLSAQQPSKGEETTQCDPMGWGMNSLTLSRTFALIDFQPAKRQPFQKFSIKVTFVCLSPHPCMLGVRYPILQPKKDHTSRSWAIRHIWQSITMSATAWIYLCLGWLRKISLGVCVLCVRVCREGAKGGLYQVANMFPILWVLWLWTIVSAVCSLLSWSFSLLWVRARPRQYLFSTNTAPAQRHIVHSLFN